MDPDISAIIMFDEDRKAVITVVKWLVITLIASGVIGFIVRIIDAMGW